MSEVSYGITPAQKHRAEILATNGFNLCTELFKLCKDGYTTVNMTALRTAHHMSHDFIVAIRNLGIVKDLGSGSHVKHYWRGDMPSLSMVNRILIEAGRIAANRNLEETHKKKIVGRKLVPIIGSSLSLDKCLQTLKDLHHDHRESTVMDPVHLTKDKNIPGGFFEVLESLDVVKKSVVPGMYIWSGEEPTISMAELVYGELSSTQVPSKPVVADVNKSESATKSLSFLLELKQKIDDNDGNVRINAMLKDHHILTGLSQILQTHGIIVVRGKGKYTWVYDGDINLELATKLHKALYESRRKYFVKKQAPEPEIKTAETKSVATETTEHTDIIKSLRAEERRLHEYIQSLPEYKKLQAIRQTISTYTAQ